MQAPLFSISHAQTASQEIGDPVLFLKKTTDGLGADFHIDAVGAEANGSVTQNILAPGMKMFGGATPALHWAINSVKKGGIVSIVGVYGPIEALVPIGNVLNKGLTIRANTGFGDAVVAAPRRTRAKRHARPQSADYSPHSVGVCVGWIPDFFGETR